jgi:hypothetical protein
MVLAIAHAHREHTGFTIVCAKSANRIMIQKSDGTAHPRAAARLGVKLRRRP